ncbi:hypothetical protein Tamer19_23800 [Cupriavidus sp. TA19]|uniref:hypothetical protein n=1 Tax=unclassified Cupriavidus TaxID=2640874 RepID=UPI002729452F|nr:hypothetical protein [Cupriavidus sp. TA19]GLC92972.1 hypothetical protein Tamer19_23800 [Cupriavidus sp. TA19]
MTGTALNYVETSLRLTGTASRPGAFLRTRTEITGMPHVPALVGALPGDGNAQRSIEAALRVLAQAGHQPVRTVVSSEHGRQASLDFYVEADVAACCELDGALQRQLASHCTSVLPPGLALSVRPLGTYVPDGPPAGEHGAAERLRRCASELLCRGGEMNQRLSAVCAYLAALHEAQAAAERLGHLDQSLFGQGQEALSWRLRRHRSVEGRALAQVLEGLSRAADGALHELGRPYSADHARYQFEQMQRFHDQIERFRSACSPE